MIRTASLAALLLLFVSHVATASELRQEIGPETDWCAAANALAPGSELALRPGDYQGGCVLRRGGTESAPIVITGSDPARATRIVYLGKLDNAVNIRANHVTLRNLTFGPTLPDVDGVRIYDGNHVTIEYCRFLDLGGIAIAATSHSIRGVVARRNSIVRSRATAMYLGCHDGAVCAITDVLLEQNYVSGVEASGGQIGYGIQIKLNSEGIVRDNVILDTRGPGIMIYGGSGPSGASVVERNYVAGSRTSSGIVVGGGPAVIRNNVAVRNAEAGIAVEDYRKRGLLRDIVVAHNTVWNNLEGGIAVEPSARVDVKLLGNAVHASRQGTELPRARPGIISVGNAGCNLVACFANPRADDFSPASLAPILQGWTKGLVVDDFFGRPRPEFPTAGAVEPPGGPIAPRVKAGPDQ